MTTPATTAITLPAINTLPAGSFFAGLILKEDGAPDYWLVGLPGELDAADWQTAMDWAKKQGGDLPNRRELNLLRANARQYFKSAWYWSSEQHESESGWAWNQVFCYGRQGSLHKSNALRARAVRRLVIE